MSYFEICHNGKLQHLQQPKTLNDELEKTPQGRTKVETLLQWHTTTTTTADLEKAVLFYKRDKILQGVKFLASKGVIELHSNPEPRLWFDRTQHYLFIPDTVNAWIDERFPPDRNSIVDKSEMHPRNIDTEQLRKIDNEVEQRIPLKLSHYNPKTHGSKSICNECKRSKGWQLWEQLAPEPAATCSIAYKPRGL